MKISIHVERRNKFADPDCKVKFELGLTGEANVDFVLSEAKKAIMGAWKNFVKREKSQSKVKK